MNFDQLIFNQRSNGDSLQAHIISIITTLISSHNLCFLTLGASKNPDDQPIGMPCSSYVDFLVGIPDGKIVCAIRVETVPSRAGARPWSDCGIEDYINSAGYNNSEHPVPSKTKSSLDTAELPVIEYQWAVIFRMPRNDGTTTTMSWAGTPFQLNLLDDMVDQLGYLVKED